MGVMHAKLSKQVQELLKLNGGTTLVNAYLNYNKTGKPVQVNVNNRTLTICFRPTEEASYKK